jgi:hypothetical protein
LNERALMIMLRGGFKRITLLLGKIKIRMIFVYSKYQNFIFHLLTYNSFVSYRLHDFVVRDTKENKKNI